MIAENAQQWFDRGLAWVYGYNHEKAIVCFEQALKEDPACAMARWGIAYAIGPNYNRWGGISSVALINTLKAVTRQMRDSDYYYRPELPKS